jgi:hypothetical protein
LRHPFIGEGRARVGGATVAGGVLCRAPLMASFFTMKSRPMMVKGRGSGGGVIRFEEEKGGTEKRLGMVALVREVTVAAAAYSGKDKGGCGGRLGQPGAEAQEEWRWSGCEKVGQADLGGRAETKEVFPSKF